MTVNIQEQILFCSNYSSEIINVSAKRHLKGKAEYTLISATSAASPLHLTVRLCCQAEPSEISPLLCYTILNMDFSVDSEHC